MAKFLCPLPWMSLSFGAKSVPRLCCHQVGSLEFSENENLVDLNHLENIREKMMRGEVPALCQSCFKLEESGCASPREDYISRFGQGDAIRVRYLDVTFNNDCNLECLMCSPVFSYKLNKLYYKELSLPQEKPWQVELTNKMLEELLPDLEMITITGGEPFVSKKILDFITLLSESPFAKNLTLRVFTNLSQINHSILNRLEKFKKVEVLLSIDSVGENYEFIRYPALWDTLVSNIEFLNRNKFPHLDIHLHAVLMSSNWLHIGELIKFYSTHIIHLNTLPIFVEIDTPRFLHPGVLPDELFNLGLSNIEKELLALGEKVNDTEKEGLRILLKKISSNRNPNLYLQYKVFLSKLDKARRGSNEK